MEISQKMRDEVTHYYWRLMKLDRCRSHWGMGEHYTFPNGIQVNTYFGRRPIRVQVDAENAEGIESLIGNREYTKRNKRDLIEFQLPFENKGKYVNLLWDLYMIGNVQEEIDWEK